MLGEIDFAANGAEEQPLLALAQLLVSRLFLGREDFVGL